jgi:hypothetical protein
MKPDDLSSHVVRALQELEELEDYLNTAIVNAYTDGIYAWQCVRKVARILRDGMQLAAVGKETTE